MNTSILHNYVFHYNEYKKLWNAIPRELINQYWDNHKLKDILSSSDLNVLLEIVNKLSYDSDFINKIK